MQKIYHGDTFISRKEGEKRGFFTVTELDWDEHDVQRRIAERFPELEEIAEKLDEDDIFETLIEPTDYICGFEYFDSDAWPMTLYGFRNDITDEVIARIIEKHRGNA